MAGSQTCKPACAVISSVNLARAFTVSIVKKYTEFNNSAVLLHEKKYLLAFFLD